MDSVSAHNMAKGLNVYRAGRQGAAVPRGSKVASASTGRVVAKSGSKALPPLKLKTHRVKKAS